MDEEQFQLKKRIKEGWDLSAPGFTDVVVPGDLSEPGRSTWTDLILGCIPAKANMKVLDVGAGPGVFSILMAMKGHSAIGIDVSDKMVKEAQKNSEKFNVSPEFCVMDSDDMSFADETFDLIISRDAMWVMPDPEKTYREWYRVLKSGGYIVYFDGGHPARDKDFDISTEYSSQKSEYIAKTGEAPKCSYKPEEFEKARGFKRDLPLTYIERPKWDKETAKKTGFVDVDCKGIDSDLKVVDNAKDCGGYNRFRIVARKP